MGKVKENEIEERKDKGGNEEKSQQTLHASCGPLRVFWFRASRRSFARLAGPLGALVVSSRACGFARLVDSFARLMVSRTMRVLLAHPAMCAL